MAEPEKKKVESKGGRRYGHGPRIEPKEGKGDEMKDNGAGAPKEAESEARKTAGSPKPEVDKETDEGPSGTEAAGTDHIPVSDDTMGRHSRERKEMVERHEDERHEMGKRHEKEHKSMHRRHAKELGTEAMPETDEGESGTEPK